MDSIQPSPYQHPWNVTPEEARIIQDKLKNQIRADDRFSDIQIIGGADVGFEDNHRITRAALSIHSYPDLRTIDTVIVREKTNYPYIPGLLSFRETPALLKAFNKLKYKPDLLLCDSQGVAHPRRFGLASHFGLLADLPTIGVAKSRLVGEYEEPPAEKGKWEWLRDGNEIIGMVLRSRTNVKPIFVSVGHRISINSARKYVMGSLTRYKLPEPIRNAHRLASE